MERPSLSASQLQAYLACPLKYRFHYVDRIPKPWQAAALAFGTSVHAAVEWFHRQRMAGTTPELPTVLSAFDADWSTQTAAPLIYNERESAESLAEKARGMLTLYVEGVSGPPPLAVEQPFAVELSDPETGEALELWFRGVIDLIEADGTLVDLKTAARALESGGLERHLQLSCYALCVLLQRGAVPLLRLDMLYKTQRPRFERLRTTRTIHELAWTARLIAEVARAIETEHFFPNPSWRCGECEYFAHCQQWRGEEASLSAEIEVCGGGAGDTAA